LLDVSGSMSDANKLPLVKQSIALLLSKLKPSDTVSIVVYAGAAGVVLEPTEARNKSKILAALQRLNAGGSTAGGAGIELAYQLAEQTFNADAVNRIILATDGDFNVGQESNEALKALVERKRDNGVFLSILGFGRNNYQDDMMQTLAQNGNGVAAYIDSISEAKKVLVNQASSTLFTIAKDVKLQVEFNPKTVSDYRLVGYETRHLNREDFNNDNVDAGDIGAGHTVTAIYEITPSNVSNTLIEPLRYATTPSKDSVNKRSILGKATDTSSNTTEYGFLKIRYKLPTQSVSKLIEQPIFIAQAERNPTEQSDLNFSVAAASFAQYLKGGKYTGKMTLSDITGMAKASKGDDPYGYRSEFIRLLELAEIAKP
jgi:Ca-activated chloride channel family protein